MIKHYKFLTFIFTLTFLLMSKGSVSAQRTKKNQQSLLSAGTVVWLNTSHELLTDTLSIERWIPLKVQQSVMANGHVVIPAGAQGAARVIEVSPGTPIKPATIRLRACWVIAADGQTIAIDDTLSFEAAEPMKPVRVPAGSLFVAQVVNNCIIKTP